jgi:hypothetical protein
LGRVERRGKRRKICVGSWHDYILIDNAERRGIREKVPGTVKEIRDRRPSAMTKLRDVRSQLESQGRPDAATPPSKKSAHNLKAMFELAVDEKPA